MKTNRSQPVIRSKPTCRDGFTLLDLLVVLGVIAVLILVELPVLAGTKSQTKIGVCASHVRQIVLACQIYANENNNRLPIINSGTVWPWDLPAGAANALLRSGVTTNAFYCPGTSPRFTDQDNWIAPGSSSLWNFGAPNFHVVGYALALSGPNATVTATNQNSTMLPETIKSGPIFLPAPAASDRVLLADATLSGYATLPGYVHPENNYTTVLGGFSKPHTSPHLKGNIPLGGNVGFKDGHVAWRKFELMVPRNNLVDPSFWW